MKLLRVPSRAVPPLVLGLALVAVSCGREAPPSPAPQGAAVSVRTARVGGSEEGFIEVPGAVEAAQAASLASRVSAVVESVAVEEGAFVKSGDVLVRLDGRDVRARLAAAEAGLRAARAQRDRVRSLFAKGAATQQELEGAEAADAAASGERDAANAQLEYVDLRAPFDGRVTDKKARAGDLASPGQPLLSVQGVGHLRVSATVSRGQADRMKTGQEVQAILDDGSVVPTRVAILGPAGDAASRRYLVKCDLPRRAPARAGSFARLRLPRAGDEEEVLVPRTAIFERGALTGVFVVEGGKARLRWVSPGAPAGDALVVRAGLAPGDEVILAPGALRDGTPVVPASAADAERR